LPNSGLDRDTTYIAEAGLSGHVSGMGALPAEPRNVPPRERERVLQF